MDHRIKRSGGTLGSLDYYLEGDHLESVYSGGALQEKFFRGSTIDELVAGYEYQGGALTPFMFQHDHVMSVSATTKTNGGTQATQTFWAFGETQSTTGSTVTRLRFTGREDDGTGLMQYRARYYYPTGGFFISEDPKKFAAGINFCAYCNNDPIDNTDPMGLRPLTPGEVDMVKTVYNDKVDYSKVDVQSGVGLDPRTWGPIGTGAAVTLENTIRFPNNGYQSDFSVPNVPNVEAMVYQKWLVHEVGHVYQYQNDPNYSWVAAAAEGLRADTYKYTLDATKALPDYRYEQQATLLADTYQAQVNKSPNIGSYQAIVQPNGLGQSRDFDFPDVSAAGGYLIYPNKPNNNSLTSVYRK